MRREWVLASVSVLISLVLLEGAVRLYYVVRDSVPPSADDSLRNEWAWARSHLREGEAEVAGSSDYDAQFGWRPAEDIDAWIRRKGWGLPQGDLTLPQRPRVLFIGDSFTYGLYVADDESFAVRLGADHLRDHEIVNLGVNGYGADQMLLLYETIGRRYHPNVVVMGFYVAGFERARSRFTFYAKPWFDLDENSALRLHGEPVIAPQMLYGEYAGGARQIAGWPYSYLWGAVGASVRRLRDAHRIDGPNDGGWPLMTALLERFANDVTADDAVPVLLIIPSRPEEFQDSIDEDLDRLARDDACRFGILPVSLADAFDAAAVRDPAAKLFRARDEGGHFSVAGHALAASELARALRQHSQRCPSNERSEAQLAGGAGQARHFAIADGVEDHAAAVSHATIALLNCSVATAPK